MIKRYDINAGPINNPLSDRRSDIGNKNYIIGQDYSGKIARYSAGTSSGYGAQRVGLYASDLHKSPRTRPYYEKDLPNGFDNLRTPIPNENHFSFYRGRRIK